MSTENSLKTQIEKHSHMALHTGELTLRPSEARKAHLQNPWQLHVAQVNTASSSETGGSHSFSRRLYDFLKVM